MRKIIFLIVCVFGHFLAMAKGVFSDTCNFNFVENGATANINKLINLEEIIESNKGKDFYLAMIRVYDDVNKKKRIILRDCSNVGVEKIVLFDGLVVDMKYVNVVVDTSILFKHIGDNARVTFNATECRKAFHSDLKV